MADFEQNQRLESSSRFQLHPNPMIAAQCSDDKSELMLGDQFRVSRIESQRAVLIENQRRRSKTAILGLWVCAFLYVFGSLIVATFTGAIIWADIFSLNAAFFRHSIFLVILGGGFAAFICLVFDFFRGVNCRRILICDGELRFKGLPWCGLVVTLDLVQGIYVVTKLVKGGWVCRVAFAIKKGNRTRLLYAHIDDIFSCDRFGQEKQLIRAYWPLVKLLKELVGKPVRFQRDGQKSAPKIRAYWR